MSQNEFFAWLIALPIVSNLSTFVAYIGSLMIGLLTLRQLVASQLSTSAVRHYDFIVSSGVVTIVAAVVILYLYFTTVVAPTDGWQATVKPSIQVDDTK